MTQKSPHGRLNSRALYVFVLVAGFLALLLLSHNGATWKTILNPVGSWNPERKCEVISSRDIDGLSPIVIPEPPQTPADEANVKFSEGCKPKVIQALKGTLNGYVARSSIPSDETIDPKTDLIEFDVTLIDDRRVVSVTVNDPALLAEPGRTISLVFVETSDTRATSSTPSPSPRIDDVLVIRVDRPENEDPTLVVAIPADNEDAMATLSRFANLIPAQVVLAPRDEAMLLDFAHPYV